MSIILIFAHLTKIVFSEWNAYKFFLVSEFHGKWKSFECRICDNQDLFYPFRAKLVKTNVIVYLRWNLASRLTQICWIWWWHFLFLFWSENTFSGQIWSKRKNCPFQMKFGAWTNSNMLISMIRFTFPVLNWNTFFMQI